MRQRPSLIAVYSILFLDNFSFAFAYPLLPLLFLYAPLPFFSDLNSNLKHALIGLTTIAPSIGMFLGPPLFGWLSDVYGRKIGLFLTLTGTLLGYLLTALGVLLSSFGLILFSRLLAGFFSANLSLCLACMADIKKEKRMRSKHFSWSAATLGISWILAFGLSFLLLRHVKILNQTIHLLFWSLAALTLISISILNLFFIETKTLHIKRKPRLFEAFYIPETKQLKIAYLALFFLFFGFYISLQWITPLSLEVFRASKYELVFVLLFIGILWMLSSSVLNPWLINEFSIWKILVWALFLLSLFYFFAGITSFFFYFAFSYLISAIFSAMAWANNLSLISLSSRKENLGKNLGISQSIMAIPQFFGPFFASLVTKLHREALYLLSSLFILIAFLIILVFLIQKENSKTNPQTNDHT